MKDYEMMTIMSSVEALEEAAGDIRKADTEYSLGIADGLMRAKEMVERLVVCMFVSENSGELFEAIQLSDEELKSKAEKLLKEKEGKA